MVIGVDIDGVIADSIPVILENVRRLCGIKILPRRLTVYRIESALQKHGLSTSESNAIVKKAIRMTMERQISGIRMVPKAKPVLRSLEQMGHKVIVVTNRDPIYASETIEWLRKRAIPSKTVIFTSTKSDLARMFDVFVEDSASNARRLQKGGVIPILYDRPWNRRTRSRMYRIRDWPEIFDVLEKINDRASKGTKSYVELRRKIDQEIGSG